jgi:hypothetical protein
LAIYVAITGISLVSNIELARADFDAAGGVRHSRGEVLALQSAVSFASSARLATYIVTGIFFLVWLHRSYRLVQFAGATEPLSSPAAAVWSWFIPLASIWLGPKTVADLNRSTLAAHREEPRQRVGLVINAWRAGFFVAIASDVVPLLSGQTTLVQLADRRVLFAISDLIYVVFAALCAAVVAVVGARATEVRATAEVLAPDPPAPPPTRSH